MFGRKKNGKVLIVEDDALLAKVLSQGFAAENFEVGVVENGLESLDMAKKFQPKIILLDLMLPGIDGFEVLKQLKESEETKNIPVIVISNLDQVSDVKSAKVLGAEEYFIKANTQLQKIIDYTKSRIG
ncbi:MAG: Response regulator receiver domain protein [Candidatus Magasanikbacteria bacterium GW2011_GWC2_40_17]|uniref:Response regulator receiver domain protein n=1 Tax=Candidatus Magasanikbacteria bacterium GW2011_GWA2_42_32 TaxID=1619039 RepID=A0A0G1D4I1_9BACT|nr:MAG: Response regulator receiver domain protein [Candidatus Magasanikbacteria bacterium GW2011_GWC2_40_17]KKS56943.1 MAG: Response regulator receiver domain protein [Candidatus Magasanikbacteria bacterium GW2011_GWA2_42_32]OGH85489.1 MAG: hypothetical protein A2294_03080 [Candidatus Magasanikbacteria bacterium RIFOXYB2_FULL_38_10]OGZ86242.1 MAG: hypothetical protein A2463_01440 [Candidatus Staskawiczbacteria bacterium RIFOXYC2_FULL_32_10]